jgi:tellurite resistance protein TerC
VAGMIEIFHFLNYGLAIILAFIGAKMIASEFINIPIVVALGVVLGVLAISILASVLFPKKREAV